MASYLEMVNLLEKEARPRRCMYVSGNELVLAEDCIELFITVVGALPSAVVRLDASSDSMRDVWDEANNVSASGARRVVVVREAQKFTASDFEKLQRWVEDRSIPNNFLVLSANAPDWPGQRKQVDGRWGMVFEHQEARKRMKASGRLVNTSLPKDPERAKQAAAAIICGWGEISMASAGYCFAVTGSIAASRDVMRKAAYFRGEVTTRVIDALAVRSDGMEFVDALLACDKRRAATAAAGVGRNEIRSLLPRLEEDVLIAAALNRALRSEERVGKLADKAGVSVTRAMRLSVHAAKYDGESVGRRLGLISQSNGREGSAEILAMGW